MYSQSIINGSGRNVLSNISCRHKRDVLNDLLMVFFNSCKKKFDEEEIRCLSAFLHYFFFVNLECCIL